MKINDIIYIVFKGTNRWIGVRINGLKVNNAIIQFTFEMQIDNKINFLDFSINICNKKFNFNIYKKPTQTDNNPKYDSTVNFQKKFLTSFLYYINTPTKRPINVFNYINNIIYDVKIKYHFSI